MYTLTVENSIGNVRSHQDGKVFCDIMYLFTNYIFMYLVTSDVQAVNATVVVESIIDIQCWFIHGSDALRCKVVLVSDCPNISDVHANLSRSDMSASGQLGLIHNISCYLRMFAFDIDVNNTISSLTIEGTIRPMIGSVHINGEAYSYNVHVQLLNYLQNLVWCSIRKSFLFLHYHIYNTNHNPVYHNCSGCYNNLCYTTK